ncbi:OprD family outer membrane porin [Pseudomonas sp. NFX15]|uniref:OprD family outer membrane porin n=1 Tax=Pseudomonas sp. NFX15 TaxID=2816958 RepID=UPI003B8C0B3B
MFLSLAGTAKSCRSWLAGEEALKPCICQADAFAGKPAPTGVGGVPVTAGSLHAHADDTPQGFVEGSSARLLARNMYFNRNSLSHSADARGWGQGFLLDYQSGFTPGDIGFGADGSVYTAYKLDGGACPWRRRDQGCRHRSRR